MSRGLGKNQRKGVLALWEHEEGVAGGMPLAELKRCISTDRANARRAIRGLMDRGMVAETRDEEGVRRVQLTGGAHLALWLAWYPEYEPLTLSDVPSRPLVLDVADEDPLGSSEPSWINAASSEPAVSDPGPSSPERGDPMSLGKPHVPSPPPPDRGISDNRPNPERGNAMQEGISHANPSASPDPPVSDNGERSGSTVREMIAKMAQEWLDRLDEEAGEERA